MTAIDAHLHVWNRARADYPWLADPEVAPIAGDHGLDEVLPSLRDSGIGRVVLVQAADNDDDTDNMLVEADAHPEVVGVVAWLPLDEPDRAAERLGALRRDRRVVGVRSLIHDRADPRWILGPEPDAGLGVLEAAGVPYDYVTASPATLEHLPVIGERHPELRIVLDHLGKPPVGDDLSEWTRLLAAAAQNPLLSAKVSGLDPARPQALRPVLDTALELFGPDRLLYGGDWPVSDLVGGYGAWWAAIRPLLDELGETARSAILSGTAERVYRIAPQGC
jgi:L-fuconolactonase